MPLAHTRPMLTGALLCVAAAPAFAVPQVAVDIAPIHSIVARVMAGLGEPGLILPVGASPHGYSLRPSDASKLNSADIVVWVGPDLTPWMEHPVEALSAGAKVITLEDMPGLTLLPIRAGGPFEAHQHSHEAEGAEEPGHDDPDHDAGGEDGHIWLDPDNAAAMAKGIAATLAAADPANAAAYAANAAAFATEMTALTAAITADLAPARDKPFIVFHDAYQYFEHRFDFPAAGSISLAEGEAPGAARVAQIRDRVKREGVVCAFTEPQFEPKLLATVIEGTDMRTGVLDPDGGMGLTPGPNLYPTMLLNIAQNLAACLDQ